jgi:hypothetical protein
VAVVVKEGLQLVVAADFVKKPEQKHIKMK